MSTLTRELFEKEPASPLYVAVNRVVIKNDPELMRSMKQSMSKMCLATALSPGFQGFHIMKQIGACPMGYRWAARPNMGRDLSHIQIDMFTFWNELEDHENFHLTYQNVIYQTYEEYGSVLFDGPDELLYRIVKSDLPILVSLNQLSDIHSARGDVSGYAIDSGQTATVQATHHVRPGKTDEFEAGTIETLDLLKRTSGMLGSQVLKRIGISSLGSGVATFASLTEALQTGSASGIAPVAEDWEGYPMPPEYLVVVEFETEQALERSMNDLQARSDILAVYGPKVLDNSLRIPSSVVSESISRDDSYRGILHGIKEK